MIQRVIIYLSFAAVFGIINYFVFQYVGIEFRPIIVFVYAYMATVGIGFEYMLIKQPDAKKFIVAYMGYSGGKMFLSLFVLLIYIFGHRDYMLPFALSFLVAYFSFTGLEISRLLSFFKK